MRLEEERGRECGGKEWWIIGITIINLVMKDAPRVEVRKKIKLAFL